MTLIDIITSQNAEVRNQSVDEFAARAATNELIAECRALDEFWRHNENLYERVRALLFLYAIYRFHLSRRSEIQASGLIPFEATEQLLKLQHELATEMLERMAGAASS